MSNLILCAIWAKKQESATISQWFVNGQPLAFFGAPSVSKLETLISIFLWKRLALLRNCVYTYDMSKSNRTLHLDDSVVAKAKKKIVNKESLSALVERLLQAFLQEGK